MSDENITKTKSGIGNGQDLKSYLFDNKKLDLEYADKLDVYLNGYKTIQGEEYNPEIEADFRLWAEGKYYDTYQPIPYEVDIETYPNLKYDYELRKVSNTYEDVMEEVWYNTWRSSEYHTYVGATYPESPKVLPNGLDWEGEEIPVGKPLEFTYRLYIEVEEWIHDGSFDGQNIDLLNKNKEIKQTLFDNEKKEEQTKIVSNKSTDKDINNNQKDINIEQMAESPGVTTDGYQLNIFVDGNGSVEIEPEKNFYDFGDEVILKAIPDEHHKFEKFYGDKTFSSKEVEIEMTEDIDLVAVFNAERYDININFNGQGNIDFEPRRTSYKVGEEITITATPNDYWQFGKWQGYKESTLKEIAIEMPDHDVELEVWFRPEIHINIEGEGDVDISPEKSSYEYGSSVTLKAEPDEGWGLKEWRANHWSGYRESKEITLHMNRPKHIDMVLHELGPFRVNVDTFGQGDISLSPSRFEYDYGETVEISATPDTGWTFHSFYGDYNSTNDTLEFEITSDTNITAVFGYEQKKYGDVVSFKTDDAEYRLTIDISGDGDVNVVGESQGYEYTYNYGDEVELEALPEEDIQFIGWSGDISGTEENKTITIEGNTYVHAVFNETGYSINIEIEGEGTVNLSPNKDVYYEGESVEIEAQPAQGWDFKEWTGDIETESKNINIEEIDQSYNIEAIFETEFYTIDLDVAQGDALIDIFPEQDYYEYGQLVNIIVTPARGYNVDYWMDDLSDYGDSTNFEVTVTDDIEATVVLEEVPVITRLYHLGGGDAGDYIVRPAPGVQYPREQDLSVANLDMKVYEENETVELMSYPFVKGIIEGNLNIPLDTHDVVMEIVDIHSNGSVDLLDGNKHTEEHIVVDPEKEFEYGTYHFYENGGPLKVENGEVKWLYCDDFSIKVEEDYSPYNNYDRIDAYIKWTNERTVADEPLDLLAHNHFKLTKEDYNYSELGRYEGKVERYNDITIELPSVSEMDFLTKEIIDEITVPIVHTIGTEGPRYPDYMLPDESDWGANTKSQAIHLLDNSGYVEEPPWADKGYDEKIRGDIVKIVTDPLASLLFGWVNLKNKDDIDLDWRYDGLRHLQAGESFTLTHGHNTDQFMPSHDLLEISTESRGDRDKLNFISDSIYFNTDYFYAQINGRGFYNNTKNFTADFEVEEIKTKEKINYHYYKCNINNFDFSFQLPAKVIKDTIDFHIELVEARDKENWLRVDDYVDIGFGSERMDKKTKSNDTIIIRSDYSKQPNIITNWQSEPVTFDLNMSVEEIGKLPKFNNQNLAQYFDIPPNIFGPFSLTIISRNGLINTDLHYYTAEK